LNNSIFINLSISNLHISLHFDKNILKIILFLRKIYDGDILRFSNGNIGKVFLSNLRAGFDVAFNGAIPEELDAGLADRSEVLGNIHENKELINETIEI